MLRWRLILLFDGISIIGRARKGAWISVICVVSAISNYSVTVLCIIIVVKYYGGVYRIMKQKGFLILNNTRGTRIRYKYE